MIDVPNMVMIGGNSRNSGKTTLACKIISKLSSEHEVIGLKVTSIRPGEEDMHGNHSENNNDRFSIFEELNTGSSKDTSKMLQAGATHVYYIRVADDEIEQAVLLFLSGLNVNQVIVCESRSLRQQISPGLFLMMMRLPVEGMVKDVSSYLHKANKVFYFKTNNVEMDQYIDNMQFMHGKFNVS